MMHDYDRLRPVFAERLGAYFNPPAFMDGPEGLNVHMYLGHVLSEAAGSTDDEMRRSLSSLVDSLQFDGDDDCRELVHVSFFENMDHLTRDQVSTIYDALTPRMRKVMTEAFKLLGYDL